MRLFHMLQLLGCMRCGVCCCYCCCCFLFIIIVAVPQLWRHCCSATAAASATATNKMNFHIFLLYKKMLFIFIFFLLCCLPERPRLHLIYSIPEEEFRGVECGWAAIADHAQKQRRILLVYEILFVCCALNLVLGVNIKMHVKMQTCYVGVIVGVEWDWVKDVRRKVAAYEAKACWLDGWMEMAIRNYDTFNYRSRMTCSTWLADSKYQARPPYPSPVPSPVHATCSLVH